MASPINKKTLQHLAKLARIELNHREEEKLLKELQKIVKHFEELGELDTTAVLPATGGTSLTNIFRDDEASESTNRGAGRDAFPEEHDGFLKIPPIF